MRSFKNVKVLSALALAAVMAGCASMAVTNDAIQQKTSFALGMTADQFTISDRVDDGLQSRYTATTKNGKVYMCYVEGTVTITGRVVSDAVCSEMGKNSAPMCNDLLKAAGKC